MKPNQFIGGILVGLAFGILFGVALATDFDPDAKYTKYAGLGVILAITGVAAARGSRKA